MKKHFRNYPTEKQLNKIMADFCEVKIIERNGLYLYYEEGMPTPESWRPAGEDAPDWQRLAVMETIMEKGLIQEYMDTLMTGNGQGWSELKDKEDILSATFIALTWSNYLNCMKAAIAAKLIDDPKQKNARPLLRLV